MRLLIGIFILLYSFNSIGNDTEKTSLPIYKFGITPWQHGQSADDIKSLYKPMLRWLGKEVNAKFVIVSARDYNQMIELLAHEHIHIGSISPLPYILAQSINPDVEMLVTELSLDFDNKSKSAVYNSMIVARNDRTDIQSIGDLRGKKFGYVSNQSTSGYIYPSAFFKRLEINPVEYFRRVYFLGSHPRLTDAIAAGSIDAGATWDYNLKQAVEKHGAIFKIIEITGEIPNLGIAVNSLLDNEMKEAIGAALLRIDDKLLEGLPAAGYVIKDNAYYDEVREILRSITVAEQPIHALDN